MADREPVRGLVTEATLLLGSLLVCGVFMFRGGFQRTADVPSDAGRVEEKTQQFGPCLYFRDSQILKPTASVFLNRALTASTDLLDINPFFLTRTASIRKTGGGGEVDLHSPT